MFFRHFPVQTGDSKIGILTVSCLNRCSDTGLSKWLFSRDTNLNPKSELLTLPKFGGQMLDPPIVRQKSDCPCP